jgi:hypothetical protein
MGREDEHDESAFGVGKRRILRRRGPFDESHAEREGKWISRTGSGLLSSSRHTPLA